LSKEVAKAEQEFSVKLFTSEPGNPDFVADEEKGKALFTRLLIESIRELEITNPRPKKDARRKDELKYIAEHQKICDLSILFSTKKIDLNDDDFLNFNEYSLNPF